MSLSTPDSLLGEWMGCGVGLVCVLRKGMHLCVDVLCVRVYMWRVEISSVTAPVSEQITGLEGSELKGSVSPWVEVIR